MSLDNYRNSIIEDEFFSWAGLSITQRQKLLGSTKGHKLQPSVIARPKAHFSLKKEDKIQPNKKKEGKIHPKIIKESLFPEISPYLIITIYKFSRHSCVNNSSDSNST